MLVALLALTFGAYAIAVRGADRLSARTVLASIAALHALVLLAPPLLSTDVFSYQAYARMFAHYGSNPYLHGPHAIELDPVYPFIGAKWVNTPTAYGPLFTALSALLAPLSIAGSVIAYKAIAACPASSWSRWCGTSPALRGLDPVKAVALVGLNPLVVIYGVGGGHNDLLMLVAMMAGVCCCSSAATAQAAPRSWSRPRSSSPPGCSRPSPWPACPPALGSAAPAADLPDRRAA